MARVKGVSKNPEQARRKIVASALKAFAKHGYSAASTEQIAEDAGYSQATVFFHFKTKVGLLKACFDEVQKSLQGMSLDPGQIGVLEFVKQLDHLFDDLVITNFFVRLMMEDKKNKASRSLYMAYRDQIHNRLRAEIVNETGVPPEEAMQVAGAIVCMSLGVHVSNTIEAKPFNRSEYSAMILKSTQLLVDDLHRQQLLKKQPAKIGTRKPLKSGQTL